MLLEARGLEVGYPIAGAGIFAAARVLPIVRDVTLTLEPGQTLGVVGESGCGKSTLGRALIRLLRPTVGQVLWQGADMAGMTPRELRRRRAAFQIIFQDPVAALDPRMTLGRIVSRPWRPLSRGCRGCSCRRALWRRCGRSACRRISPGAIRMNCRAGRRKGWASRGR